MEDRQTQPPAESVAADDATDNQSVGDVVPDKLLAPKVSTYRLPRFSSRRLSSNSSFGDHEVLPRTKSMFPDPRELTKDDLTSADALMADDVFTMNATLSTVIENALGHPIPGLEVRFRDLELSAEVPQIKSGSLEVSTLWTQVQQGVGNIFGSKQFTVEKKILRGVTGAFKPGRITLVLGQPGSGKSSLMKVLANRFHMDKNITLNGDIEYNGKERSEVLDMLPRDVAYVNQIDEHYPRMTASQVPTFIEARSVFYKQRGANFFRSSAYVLAMSLSQIPMAIVETVVFGAITYWFGGYVALADRFIVFLVSLFLCQMWFTSYFFFLSSVSPNLTVAQPVMMVSVLFFMLFGGFLITKDNIPDYLIWLFWIDPLAWCIRALSINQYLAPKFDVCVYEGIDYCTTYSETIGEYSLGVFNLPTESMWIWYGWIYLFAGNFVFVFGSYLVLEYKRYESPENVAVVENDDDGEASADLTAYSQMPATPKGVHDHEKVIEIQDVDDVMGGVPTISVPVKPSGRGISLPIALAFENLWYSVPMPGGKKDEEIDLLKGVSGFALPGTMTALMGSSGAGKTTLMDVIAGRKTGGKIQGKILLNGHPANDLAIRRCTGYCEQMDIHSDSATVREALIFSAMLRQDANISTAQKMESVEECIELLELGPIADKIIRGSSTEQMKRVTIGVELVAQPSIIFMDEPTSGLDARSAKLIMNGVRKIADSGRTIVCTIHQPSTEVFNLFDSLLLLRRGGRMVFFGELGEDSKNLINYFEAFPDNAPPTIGDMTLKEYVEETFDMKHSDIWRNAMIMIILIVVFRVLALVSLRYINHLKR
ncbi:ABC transporter G family member 35 [Phytophthora fragariae]|nr:ABC transporter G family member 35 [Phytophthora fragariae]